MTVNEVMTELEGYGDERTKSTLIRHGAQEPFFGVKVGDMKKIVKKVKKNHQLSLDLFKTGNADAMYLAGLIADEKRISKEDLERWVREASWNMVSEFTVAWVAAESAYGFELGLRWIDSDQEKIATSGWATLSSLTALKNDDELDLKKYTELLHRVEQTIHHEKNRVKQTMNAFIIAVGGSVKALTEEAKRVAKSIGIVEVEMGDTACKTPLATEYIEKVIKRGAHGKKKKTVRC